MFDAPSFITSDLTDDLQLVEDILVASLSEPPAGVAELVQAPVALVRDILTRYQVWEQSI